MTNFYKYALRALKVFPPETAHRISLAALKAGLGPRRHFSSPALQMRLFGRTFSNPLGLAAGFDKDAEVLMPMLDLGFGFVEAGTVTPEPQAGNPRPRVFRDEAARGIINRMGFPGKGAAAFAARLGAFRRKYPVLDGLVGVNIGINKGAASPVADYKACLGLLAPFADYVAINVSSPNTAGLRDLQHQENLDRLLQDLLEARERIPARVPLLLKISPDLDTARSAELAAVVLKRGIDGLIVSNTTLSRPPGLHAGLAEEKGGLSGAPLRHLSTEMIRRFYRLTEGRIPIIGVGGVFSAADAYEKIQAGASLVQVYTGLVYEGPALIPRILEGLPALLVQDGFSSLQQAVGAENRSGQERLKAVI